VYTAFLKECKELSHYTAVEMSLVKRYNDMDIIVLDRDDELLLVG
jgi:hypothetical protein